MPLLESGGCAAPSSPVLPGSPSSSHSSPAALPAGTQPAAEIRPLDPQRVQDQDDMTWADYQPDSRARTGATRRSSRSAKLRVALVAIDFEDQPFVITQPKQSDPFGNPQVDPVPRADVREVLRRLLGQAGPLNHGHTIHGTGWSSRAARSASRRSTRSVRTGCRRKLFEYGLNEYNQAGGCPAGYTCDGRMERDADALWRADAGADVVEVRIVLRIYAGYDETTVWQEFGEMKFASRTRTSPPSGATRTRRSRAG